MIRKAKQIYVNKDILGEATIFLIYDWTKNILKIYTQYVEQVSREDATAEYDFAAKVNESKFSYQTQRTDFWSKGRSSTNFSTNTS